MKTTLLSSAGFWYDAAHKAQTERRMNEALCAMEQAFNHIEGVGYETVKALIEIENLISVDKLTEQEKIILSKIEKALQHLNFPPSLPIRKIKNKLV